MSSAGKTFGTASPPLEATGEDKPMGISSVGAGKPEVVPDAQQRQGYFKDAGKQHDSMEQTQSEKPASTCFSVDDTVRDDINDRLRRSSTSRRRMMDLAHVYYLHPVTYSFGHASSEDCHKDENGRGSYRGKLDESYGTTPMYCSMTSEYVCLACGRMHYNTHTMI
ncbi:hypothetical protein BC628DRAFT_1316282 [Trametes gibbosa]|nr:hypothetical protein BC628DRAFT_1316282 [Trametes gibbosa]